MKKKIDRWVTFNQFWDVAAQYLKPIERDIWMLMFRHTRAGKAKLSQGRIIKHLGCGRRTVSRAVKRLTTIDAVRILQKGRQDHDPAIYAIRPKFDDEWEAEYHG